jgi:hypothetical protein|tara:strand:+ start:1217 stop:2650 length:1434 start_codon:yes stop_codon:yes gene_type:complete
MKAIPLLLLTCFLFAPASAEELTTDNLVPGMEDFTTSGGTSFGTGSGCSTGAYCTSGTRGGGGTYTSIFDIPLTEGEVQQGFTLNSGVTIKSHSSNSVLSSCSDGVLQSGDCRDIFRLTVTLQDAGTTVETFTHQEEMDFTGLQDFTFTDVVATNNYGVLTGMLELYGIDAGFPTGFYGPQFSNPSLTIDYQTAFVQEEVLTDITDQIETETQDIIQATVAPEPVPLALPPVAEPVVALATFDTTTVSASPVDVPPVVVADIPTANAETLSSTSSVATAAPPTEPVAPTIQPLAPVSETQQAQESTAEAQIEAAVEAPAPEPATEVAEAAPEPEAPEPEAAAEVEPTEQPEPKAASKATKPAPRRKATTETAVPTASVATVSVPVTPAIAAQSVVDAIAPSQKYGAAAQTVTLIAMGVIAENRSLFKGPGIPDAAATFFSTATLPDGPSIVDKMTNYQFTGQANAAHSALVESQWRN